ncbi:MAG: Crp/Fnr family transcriptional regulator [Acidobacteria bacterium]|nr:Crp/Fnr family transcriptional regulator [Acidobacteriota bacterium]
MGIPVAMELKEDCIGCSGPEGFFCSLPPDSRRSLISILYTSSYPEGAVLFAEEDPPRGVYLVLKGRVKLSMTSAEGKTVILRIANAGDVVGLHSVVSGEPCQSTAETLELSQVAFARRENFLQFLRDHPGAALQAAKQLGVDYRTACEQVRALGLLHSAPKKLAGFLLEWASNGQPSGQGLRAKLTLTHEEIGQMIGASRETVTRTLSGFRHQRLLTLKGSTLFIQNPSALQHFTHG